MSAFDELFKWVLGSVVTILFRNIIGKGLSKLVKLQITAFNYILYIIKIIFGYVVYAVNKFLYLIKEILLFIIFWSGPWILLVVAFTGAGIISVFINNAKTMYWSKESALKLGQRYCAKFTKFIFRIWHGHEFTGLENIPVSGGALIVWYHGPLPADYIGLIAEIQIRDNRTINSIVDKFLTKIPFGQIFFEKVGLNTGGRVKAVKLLKEGQLVGVSPGGAREALFSQDYEIIWAKRTGFAKVALEANCPIIPVFTENIREAYTFMKSFTFFWRYVYEAARVPLTPMWGGYPVKLITHIGEPIYPSSIDTPESIRLLTLESLQGLIDKYQTKDPSVIKALMQRLYSRKSNEKISSMA